MTITIRKPTPADVPALGRIVFDAFASIANKHNMPLDFPSIEMANGLMEGWTAHPKVIGFVAEADGKVAGCNFIERRNPIAGVGPICIDPSHQCRGIGRQLMHAVLQVGLDARGVRLVQDAFNSTSMSLYASVGFDAREPLVLMRGKCKSGVRSSFALRPMTENDLPACTALCESVHGHHRSGELVDALKDFEPQVLERNGKLVAYASAPWFWLMNHAVAESETALRDLILSMSAASQRPIEMLVPIRQAWLFRFLLAEGLKVMKPMTLMTIGEYREPRGAWWPSVLY
jgi:predicted N-acetyltransferase YhbS